ncbi:hypothetical protein [Stieleria varia]|nr:hypothetical protein [Stieleria varia]
MRFAMQSIVVVFDAGVDVTCANITCVHDTRVKYAVEIGEGER